MALCSLFLLGAAAMYFAGMWVARRATDYREGSAERSGDAESGDADTTHRSQEDLNASESPLLQDNARSEHSDI
jgi:hypothetical protein